ncbi:hypothetical protein LOTGIDRAFT_173811 [Lottia gigantea]|uniref:Uncharacterized protein n=1 Tax=Lottia gigantea TaxID=225164 RepID=V4CBD6_LOTGI|nr:hypothetical protein LOTGIDRAFT_173811 [Lottia gigantea]ESO99169.1 hypothetical protein LOTGIDRAFT_173811 [Lottia gigantea]
MSTVIGLEDLIQHINIVYPNRLERLSDESSEECPNHDGMTSLSRSQVMPLNLTDIKKEQRRLAALMDIKSRDPLFGVPKPQVRQVHPAPKKRCIICSLPKVDRKSFSRGSFGPWAGIAIPRIPETEIYNVDDTEDDRNPDGCQHRYSDGAELFGNYSSNSFQLPTLEAEIILDETSMRLTKDRFKLPPIFDASSSSPDRGQLLALSSDKTFFNTTPRGINYDTYSGAFSGSTRSSFLSRIQESATPLQSRTERRQPVRRNTISESDLPTRGFTDEKRSRDRRRRVSTQSMESVDIPSSATLRYHHRQPSDLLPVPLNTPDTQLSEQNYNDFTYSKRELTFEFVRDGSSVYSRDTTQIETPDDVWSRVQSASWCKCSNVDFSKTRCSECLKIGGHQRWCISKLGLCPACGKVVKTSMSVVGERRVSRSPTFTFTRERSNRSPPFSPRREAMDHGADTTSGPHHAARSKPPSAELKVRFSGTDQVRPISPLESRTFEVENEDEDDDADTQAVVMEESLAHNPKSKRQKPKPSPRPSHPPDIHKHAYELALSDSRVLKHKKEKDFEKTFTNSLTNSLFSYFPKWRRPQSKSIPPEAIGLRDPDKQNGGKIKVKKGMKHILGKIKIEDYYGRGKKSK